MNRDGGPGSEPLSRDTDEWLKGKLADPWGGENISSQLKDTQLRDIAQKFYYYDTDIKVKVLIAILNMKKKKLIELQRELEAVMSVASTDSDEWVRVMVWIMQGYTTKRTLSINFNNCDNKLVETYKELARKLDMGPPRFAPHEHIYLNKSIMDEPLNPPTQHFKIRNPPVRPEQLKTKLQEIAASADDTAQSATNPLGRRPSTGLKPPGTGDVTRPGNLLDRRPSAALTRPMGMGLNRRNSMGLGPGGLGGAAAGKKYLQTKKSVVMLGQEESIDLAKKNEKRKKTEEELLQEEEERIKKREEKKKREAEEKERRRIERESQKAAKMMERRLSKGDGLVAEEDREDDEDSNDEDQQPAQNQQPVAQAPAPAMSMDALLQQPQPAQEDPQPVQQQQQAQPGLAASGALGAANGATLQLQQLQRQQAQLQQLQQQQQLKQLQAQLQQRDDLLLAQQQASMLQQQQQLLLQQQQQQRTELALQQQQDLQRRQLLLQHQQQQQQQQAPPAQPQQVPAYPHRPSVGGAYGWPQQQVPAQAPAPRPDVPRAPEPAWPGFPAGYGPGPAGASYDSYMGQYGQPGHAATPGVGAGGAGGLEGLIKSLGLQKQQLQAALQANPMDQARLGQLSAVETQLREAMFKYQAMQRQPYMQMQQQQYPATALAQAQHSQTFSLTNRLTPQLQEEIQRYINGDRENPAGPGGPPTRQIVMNEELVEVENTPYLEQIIFEMNYATRTWKRLKRKRLANTRQAI